MSVLVIGVGNPDRGDDGVGWRVVELLADEVPTLRCRGDASTLMEAWADTPEVIVVDAMSSGAPVGTIRFGAVGILPESPTSSHGFGLAQAIALAGALGSLPPHLTVIGIEGGTYEHGAPLSAAVEEAALSVAARIREGRISGRNGGSADRKGGSGLLRGWSPVNKSTARQAEARVPVRSTS
jgi:hydrogenase maturation protease